MSTMSAKPRVRVPSPVKAGDVIEVKTLISHVMETGQRRDASGTIVPRSIIHTFEATFDGAPVFRADMHQGIAANPYLAFFVKVPKSGNLVMTWTEDGGAKAVETVRIDVT